MTNATQGTLNWNGYRSGYTVIGTLAWTSSDGDVYQYSFTGERDSETNAN